MSIRVNQSHLAVNFNQLYRQVAEGAEIAYATDIDQLMNSREEWHSLSLQRISVTTEIRQPGRN